MRIRFLVLLCAAASCAKPAPSPSVTALAPSEDAFRWLDRACDNSLREHVAMDDYSLPERMDRIEVTTCGRPMFGGIADARVETQGGEGAICAIRIGPSPATGAIDASSIEALFADKDLGARVRGLVQPGPQGTEFGRFTMVDNVRVGVRQWQSVRGGMFYLVIDGCGRGPDRHPTNSSIRS